MTIIYSIIAAVLTHAPHCEAVPWGSDAAWRARYGTGRNTHPITGRPCVFYRHGYEVVS